MTRKSDAEFDALRYRTAVATRARQIARKSVKAELRARGRRPQDYIHAALTAMAEGYVRVHLKQAAEDVATFPEFAQWSINTERPS